MEEYNNDEDFNEEGMGENEEHLNVVLPIKDFIKFIEVYYSAEALVCQESSMNWKETKNEHKMIVSSSIPGGPKVFRDRLKRALKEVPEIHPLN